MGATILSGISIGSGAVIGTRAVVTKSVPPYAIVGGNPAKLIRKRFTNEEIVSLEEIAWWNWPDTMINKAMPLLLSQDINSLAAFALDQSSQLSSRHYDGSG